MRDARQQTGPLESAFVEQVQRAGLPPAARETAASWLDALTSVYRFVCSRTATVAGILLFIAGWIAKTQGLVSHVFAYDEGIILSGANAVRLGDAPYRDFYTNYPPGIFLMLAGLWKVFGVSLIVYRLLAVAFHLALGILAGRLTARVAGSRRGFSWTACAIITCWMMHLHLVPFAWLAGLALLLFAVDRILWALDLPSRRRFMIAGVAYGLVSCFRHDLFVHFTWTTAALLLVPARFWARCAASKPSWKHVGHFLMGAAIPIVLVWGPIVAIAGVKPILRDIVFDQVRYVMPGRVLPMPRLFQKAASGWPTFVTDVFVQAVALTLVAPILALLHCLVRRTERTPAVFMAPVTLAVIPQMMGRTDVMHAVYTVLPAMILATAFVERIRYRTRFAFLRAALPVLFLAAFTSVVRVHYWPLRRFNTRVFLPDSALAIKWRPGFQFDRDMGVHQRAVVEYIRSHTERRERIFIGLPNHERLLVNELSLYFFANRLPGVRWSQFDPNLVTGRPVQEEMIASMERHHVRVVVLSSRWFGSGPESQPPVVPPSPLLDTYIREHFTEHSRHGVYTILTRDL